MRMRSLHLRKAAPHHPLYSTVSMDHSHPLINTKLAVCQHCCNYFTTNGLHNLHHQHVRYVLVLPPFDRWGTEEQGSYVVCPANKQ